MNMIFNKSDLVGYEAVDTKTAKKEALAKLVAAWESKQAKNAKRFGGLGLLAVSLAACNSSSDDTTTTTTTTTPTTTTATVTANNAAFTDDDASGKLPDTFLGTTAADSPTATATGTAAATLDATDVITDATSGDGDTLTVTVTGNAVSPAIVSGIENIDYEVSAFAASVPSITVTNVYGANITVNNNQLGGATTTTVVDLGNGSTLNLGKNTTGATVDGASGAMTINASTGTLNVNEISTDGATINAATGGTINLNSAAATSPTTVNLASGTVTIDGEGAAGAISMLTLSGGGTFTISDAPTAYTMAGASGGTMQAASSELTGKALTDSTTGGTTTVKISDIAAGGATVDADALAADVIEISGDDTSSAANTLQVASGSTVLLSHALDDGLTIASVLASTADTAEVLTLNVSAALGQTIVVSDYETLTVTTSGTATSLALTAAGTTDLTLNGSTTLAMGAVTAKSINAAAYTGKITHTADSGQSGTVTYGTNDDTVTATTAQTLVLDGGAGNDILNMPADMDQITFSNFEIITQAAVTASDASQWHDGSAILNGSNLIIIDSVDISTIDLSKYTVSDTGAGGDAFEITVGTNSTVDATKLASSVGLNITGNAGRDVFTGTANADTLKGGGGVDTLNGAAGKDTIEGGDGADIIDGEAGQDTLTGGAGADVFTFVKGDHTATTTADIISAADKITDFAVSSGTTKADGDEIDWSTNGTTAAVAAATDAVAGTAQIATAGAAAVFAAADDTLAERVTAVEAAIHANGQADGAAALFGHGGNSYVFISEGTTGADDSGDTLIELTGFDSTGKTLEVNADDFFIY